MRNLGSAAAKRLLRPQRLQHALGFMPGFFEFALGVGIGDEMVIELQGDELRLRSRQDAIKRVQAIVRKTYTG